MAKNDEKYAYLNRLNTEQLEELLRMDMEMAEPGNEDVVFHILEVIEQREDAVSYTHLTLPTNSLV